MQLLLASLCLGLVASVRPQTSSSDPLHTAVFKGHTGAIALLVADGEDVNGLEHGVTPLGIACKKGNQLLVEALIEQNADVNMKTGPHKKKELPLGIAAYADQWDVGVVQALLAAKARVDVTDDYGKSALSYASERGRSIVVKALKEAGA